jgi:AcrR family transcriptional regulator
MSNPDPEDAGKRPVRERILDAAFSTFVERGYTETSTLEIATRAGVSKRELYAVVGKKQDMLVACITERAGRMRRPADMPVPRDRGTLTQVLATFGAHLLREVSDPTVIAVFRLAIAEADRAPEIARALDSIGREGSRAALTEMLAQARSSGLVHGDPAEMATQFTALLWGNLMIGLLLRVAEPPRPSEIDGRAQDAASALLRLYPQPDERAKVQTLSAR